MKEKNLIIYGPAVRFGCLRVLLVGEAAVPVGRSVGLILLQDNKLYIEYESSCICLTKLADPDRVTDE